VKRILVISDTHITKLDEFPSALIKIAEKSDLVVHAGDFCSFDVLDGLRKINDVIAVQGNMDDSSIRDVLSLTEDFEIDGVKFGLTHGYGSPGSVAENVVNSFSDVDVLIFGHSHLPYNEKRYGCLLFNPGSATDPRSAIIPTYGIIEVKNGAVELFIHELIED
jgi:putative phosphoesterase